MMYKWGKIGGNIFCFILTATFFFFYRTVIDSVSIVDSNFILFVVHAHSFSERSCRKCNSNRMFPFKKSLSKILKVILVVVQVIVKV